MPPWRSHMVIIVAEAAHLTGLFEAPAILSDCIFRLFSCGGGLRGSCARKLRVPHAGQDELLASTGMLLRQRLPGGSAVIPNRHPARYRAILACVLYQFRIGGGKLR